MNMQILTPLLIGVLLLCSSSLSAGNLIMVRTAQPLEQAEVQLRAAVSENGYLILEGEQSHAFYKGLDRSEYKVITLENPNGSASLLSRHPMLATFLPWRIALVVENGSTLLVSLNPLYLGRHLTTSDELKSFLQQQSVDLTNILLDTSVSRP